MIKSISIFELSTLNDINLIDIRSVEKYNNNHIDGAKNIPFNEIISNPSKYFNDKDVYYIYCQKGIQSRKLCQILNSLGYNVFNIQGGYEAWILNK